ncbi:hypothetical protein GCM10029963_72840 [Micromonospora andamanensis]|uniref:hypothetical protein n=1 Tax=Micromonospora andamanensis TaxID=1287068 RepID=UPI001951A8DE|nr:hypothetical protein [Micromonospora andamanensis]GIJ39722.1 hypothetical protein Vwe01_30470 [Micromonospora andamanensis]
MVTLVKQKAGEYGRDEQAVAGQHEVRPAGVPLDLSEGDAGQAGDGQSAQEDHTAGDTEV